MITNPGSTIKIFCILLCLPLLALTANSQTVGGSIFDEKSPRYGIYGSYNANIHSSEIDSVPGYDVINPSVKNGNGKGFSIGLLYELPLPGPFYLGLRAGYSMLNGKLSGSDTSTVISNTDVIKGQIQSTYTASLSEVSLEPYLLINLFKGFDLYAGGHLGFISTRKYDYVKEIISPQPAVFIDTSVSRVSHSGDIGKGLDDVYSALTFGAGYRIPLNREGTLTITPEVLYTAGMTNIFNTGQSDMVNDRNMKWSINSMKFGFSIKYSPEPPRPGLKAERNRINIVDTITIETAVRPIQKITAGLTKVTEKRDTLDNKIVITEINSRVDTLFIFTEFRPEININTPVLNIQVQDVREAFPLIPAVFFEEGSDRFSPDNVILSSKSAFSMSSLANTPLAVNNNILNIIGQRLQSNPKSGIMLTGYADSATEKAGCQLGLKRAESVRNYLVNIWGIEAKRIVIREPKKSYCSPPNPTTIQNDSGYAENRRVMIESDNPEVLAPVVKSYYETSQISPPEIIVDFDNKGNSKIKTNSISASQNGRNLFGYDLDMPSRRFTQLIMKDMATAMVSGQPLVIKAGFSTAGGVKSIVTKSVPVIKDTVDSSIERFSLILFDFASDEIKPESERVLNTMLSGRIGASIRVTGYSDILGNSEFNKDLSLRRAENTASLIKKMLPDAQILSTIGVGDSKYPSGIKSYSTPVERFLSRTVQVEIIE